MQSTVNANGVDLQEERRGEKKQRRVWRRRGSEEIDERRVNGVKKMAKYTKRSGKKGWRGWGEKEKRRDRERGGEAERKGTMKTIPVPQLILCHFIGYETSSSQNHLFVIFKIILHSPLPVLSIFMKLVYL